MKITPLPALQWIGQYQSGHLVQDLSAALVVTVLLIPQSLAYAMLAGVPPEVGLYSSILPLIAYALFGTSKTLSVGPVAIISLMTASTLGSLGIQGSADYLAAAVALALLSGLFLFLMGVFKMGFVTHFLSHPVISGFITASGIIIALSQLKHILGIPTHGDTLFELLPPLWQGISTLNMSAAVLGIAMVLFLVVSRKYSAQALAAVGVSAYHAKLLAKTAPIVGIATSIAVAYSLNLEKQGVALTGSIPSGLPTFAFSLPQLELLKQLAGPALMISVIGYVESISVGRTLASKRREKVDANQELIGLGAANVASSLSGGIPVTGGFSRSIVNFEAGAVTQLASIFAALGIALASLFLTPLLYFLPKTILAATIIVAVLTLLDFNILRKTWRFSKSDFWAISATIVATLCWGVEAGVLCGLVSSILLYMYRTSKPHIAEVGLIEGTEHFRNVQRYKVSTDPRIVSLRPDESLFFANANQLEELVEELVNSRQAVQHIILQSSAINEIDYSALEVLEALNEKLKEKCVYLHFSEIKGPVMDQLQKTDFLLHLSGKVFTSQFEAYKYLQGL